MSIVTSGRGNLATPSTSSLTAIVIPFKGTKPRNGANSQGRSTPLSPHSGACSRREAEDISAADTYGSSRHRARSSKGPRADRLEAGHRSAHKIPQGGRRKAELVCHALEDRNLPQDTEVRLQSRRRQVTHRRTARESYRDPVPAQLANLLDDDAEPDQARGFASNGADAN